VVLQPAQARFHGALGAAPTAATGDEIALTAEAAAEGAAGAAADTNRVVPVLALERLVRDGVLFTLGLLVL
jgi:hypothetical protein